MSSKDGRSRRKRQKVNRLVTENEVKGCLPASSQLAMRCPFPSRQPVCFPLHAHALLPSSNCTGSAECSGHRQQRPLLGLRLRRRPGVLRGLRGLVAHLLHEPGAERHARGGRVVLRGMRDREGCCCESPVRLAAACLPFAVVARSPHRPPCLADLPFPPPAPPPYSIQLLALPAAAAVQNQPAGGAPRGEFFERCAADMSKRNAR